MARRPKAASDDYEDVAEDLDAAEPVSEDVVTNAAEVPLFASSGIVHSKGIARLKLIKLDNPGAGYKGEIPLNSTLETIGQLFGDGLYNIEAVNHAGRRLRALENQRISLGTTPYEAQHGKAPAAPTVIQPSVDVERVERLALKSANESVQQAQAFRDLVVSQTAASAAREREFMQGVLAQQSAAAAAAAALQQQSAQQQQAFLLQAFTQQMAQQQASHTHMIEVIATMNKNHDDGGSAERLMAIFMQGMNMGRDMDAKEDEPFWQEILRGGVGLLGGGRQAQLAAMNPAAAITPKQLKSVSGAGGASKLARVAKALRNRGMDIDSLIDMLESGANPSTEPDDTEEPGADESEAPEPSQRPTGPIFTS